MMIPRLLLDRLLSALLRRPPLRILRINGQPYLWRGARS